MGSYLKQSLVDATQQFIQPQMNIWFSLFKSFLEIDSGRDFSGQVGKLAFQLCNHQYRIQICLDFAGFNIHTHNLNFILLHPQVFIMFIILWSYQTLSTHGLHSR